MDIRNLKTFEGAISRSNGFYPATDKEKAVLARHILNGGIAVTKDMRAIRFERDGKEVMARFGYLADTLFKAQISNSELLECNRAVIRKIESDHVIPAGILYYGIISKTNTKTLING